MTDYFSVFGLEPAPLLDPAWLQEEFHRRGAAAHPDRRGGREEAFRELNEAWQTLRDPARRIRHLLSLRAPALITAPPAVEPALAELFLRAGSALQKCAALRRREASAGTPLARALLAAEKMAVTENLSALRAEAEAGHTAALAQIAEIAADWSQPAGLQALADSQRQLAFYGKWMRDLGEAALNLEF